MHANLHISALGSFMLQSVVCPNEDKKEDDHPPLIKWRG